VIVPGYLLMLRNRLAFSLPVLHSVSHLVLVMACIDLLCADFIIMLGDILFGMAAVHFDFYFWTRPRLHSHMYSDFYFQTRPQLSHVVYSRAKRAISHYARHARERDCACDLVYFSIFISIISPS
jgi:hypothetical protein